MKAIILAAGKGSRLESERMEIPKALRLVAGKPLMRYVLDGLDFLPPEDITIVVGFMKEKIMETIGGAYRYAVQETLDGTAKATLCAKPCVGTQAGPVLVAYCDMPLLSQSTYRGMFDAHVQSGAAGTLLAGHINPPPPFGRLIRNAAGELVDIVEESACTEAQRRIDEVNIGLQVFDGLHMWDWLSRIDNDNPRREYYLTGSARVLSGLSLPQTVVQLADTREMLGVNTEEDLRRVEAIVRGG